MAPLTMSSGTNSPRWISTLSGGGNSATSRPMNPKEAMGELRTRSNEISKVITAMHPTVKQLGNPAAQGEILRALFELTKQVEVVKKQLLRMEKQDDSTVL